MTREKRKAESVISQIIMELSCGRRLCDDADTIQSLHDACEHWLKLDAMERETMG